jgi:hypothetical protein
MKTRKFSSYSLADARGSVQAVADQRKRNPERQRGEHHTHSDGRGAVSQARVSRSVMSLFQVGDQLFQLSTGWLVLVAILFTAPVVELAKKLQPGYPLGDENLIAHSVSHKNSTVEGLDFSESLDNRAA